MPSAVHQVVALAYPRLALFEFGVAAELFGLPRPEFPDWYRFRACSFTPGEPVAATAGVHVAVHGGLQLMRYADTIIIPGWCGVEVQPPPNLVRALQRAHRRGARLVSFCTGAFVLAATGVLNGRRAATHWSYAERLAEKYSRVRVDPNVLYVGGDNVYTSAGSAAAIDLCLHLIREDRGAEVASSVARRLVVPPYREGGQAQFIEPPPVDSANAGAIPQLMAWVEGNLSVPHSVESLAERAGMSCRTLARHFKAATGTTPLRWVLRQRVFAAQRLLETSSASIEEITTRCGFGTAASLRQHFVRTLGVAPASYRSTFFQRAPLPVSTSRTR